MWETEHYFDLSPDVPGMHRRKTCCKTDLRVGYRNQPEQNGRTVADYLANLTEPLNPVHALVVMGSAPQPLYNGLDEPYSVPLLPILFWHWYSFLPSKIAPAANLIDDNVRNLPGFRTALEHAVLWQLFDGYAREGITSMTLQQCLLVGYSWIEDSGLIVFGLIHHSQAMVQWLAGCVSSFLDTRIY